jgi:HEPN domain-containing protein
VENLKPKKLKELATDRLNDAKVLFEASRYDGAYYICGYAVEMALKHKICDTLGWDEYPSTGKGSEKYKTFKTHDFEVLLHLSGVEKSIKTLLMAEWSVLKNWESETRYSSQRQIKEDVSLMIEATEILLEHL